MSCLPTYLPTYLPTHLFTYMYYVPTYPPTYLHTYCLPTHFLILLPTHPPTYLFTHQLSTYLPIHPPISYNLPTFIPHNLVMKCRNKHVKDLILIRGLSKKLWMPKVSGVQTGTVSGLLL